MDNQVFSQRKFLLPKIRFIVFFVSFYLYVWLQIDPSLIYHGHGIIIYFPVFFQGMDFFQGFLAYPGGLIEYVSFFLSQFYYFSHIGSLIITIVAMFICLGAGKLPASLGNTHFRAVLYIPAILLLAMYNQYLNCLTTCLGLLVSLFFLWIYLLTAHRRAILRLVVFLVSSVILYYTAGGVYLLYALLCGIFEFLIKRKYLIGLFYIFLAVLIPYITYIYILEISIPDAYARILPLHAESYLRPSIAAWSIYFFFPLIALWLPLWELFMKKLGKRTDLKAQLKSETGRILQDVNFPDYYRISKLKFLYESLVLLVIIVSVALFSFNKNENIRLRINYFSYHEMWEQVLEEARRLPMEDYTFLVTHDVNKALYYTGRLLYDMFSYPQDVKALLTLSFFNPNEPASLLADLPRLSDTYFRIGMVNPAEHAAHDAVELIGEHPAFLRQLVLTNIVRGNTEIARVYLKALSKDLILGKWAERYLHYLDIDSSLSADNLVQHVRSVMLTKDYVKAIDLGEILEDLQHNKKNHMAFEYMIAYYLLSFKLEKIVQNIHRLDDFKYPDIPRHYEEAIIIYMNMTGKNVVLHGRMISQNTVQRFQRFAYLVDQYSNNRKAGIKVLARNFGDSYFLYHFLFLISEGVQ